MYDFHLNGNKFIVENCLTFMGIKINYLCKASTFCSCFYVCPDLFCEKTNIIKRVIVIAIKLNGTYCD